MKFKARIFLLETFFHSQKSGKSGKIFPDSGFENWPDSGTSLETMLFDQPFFTYWNNIQKQIISITYIQFWNQSIDIQV